MYKGTIYAGLMLALLMIPAGNAVAQDDEARVDVSGEFAQQQQRIIEDLGDGKTYSEISSADRQEVLDALSRIDTALERSGGVESMGVEHRIEVYNDQELANELLTDAAADSREVCRRERRVGTRLATTHCMTVAERRRLREYTQQELHTKKQWVFPPEEALGLPL